MTLFKIQKLKIFFHLNYYFSSAVCASFGPVCPVCLSAKNTLTSVILDAISVNRLLEIKKIFCGIVTDFTLNTKLMQR